MNPTLLRSLRLAMAAYIATAIVASIFIAMSDGTFVWHRFFSYFTVLSNLVATVVLVMLAFRPELISNKRFSIVRGGATTYMSVTFLIYVTVLYPQLVDVGVPEPWIDVALHIAGPLFMAADWFINSSRTSLDRTAFGIWFIFPVVYVVYTLIRGPIIDWYPYPILDPDEQGGYIGVAVWILIVAVVVAGFAWLYYWWVNRQTDRQGN